MAKTEMIRARMEPDLKQEAEAIFSALGISPTEAITLFYKQVTLHNGLPFEVKIPKSLASKSTTTDKSEASNKIHDSVYSGGQ